MLYGTGWLGWTEQQTLDTRIPAIELAMKGKIQMLKAIHGSADADDPKSPAPASTPKPPAPMTGKEVFAAFRRLAK